MARRAELAEGFYGGQFPDPEDRELKAAKRLEAAAYYKWLVHKESYLGKEGPEHDRRITARLKQLVLQSPYSFFGLEDDDQPAFYPDALVRYIEQEFEGTLKATHVAEVWNKSLLPVMGRLGIRLGKQFNRDRLTKLFSRLLANTMTESDEITLKIPRVWSGALNYVGAWANKGTLVIKGDLGDYAFAFARSQAVVKLLGNAGMGLAFDANAHSTIEVTGSVWGGPKYPGARK